MTETKNIAGHDITLKKGRTYRATTPFPSADGSYPIRFVSCGETLKTDVKFDDVDKALDFMKEFNGEESNGRLW